MTNLREAVARAKKEALRAGDEVRRATRNLHIVTTDDGAVKATHVDLGKAQSFSPMTKAGSNSNRWTARKC